jgi:hypothetical protein
MAFASRVVPFTPGFSPVDDPDAWYTDENKPDGLDGTGDGGLHLLGQYRNSFPKRRVVEMTDRNRERIRGIVRRRHALQRE